MVCNFVPVERREYRIGVPYKGSYKLLFNSDATEFGGSGAAEKAVKSEAIPMHGFDNSIALTLAPLSTMFFKPVPYKKRRSTKKSAPSKAAQK